MDQQQLKKIQFFAKNAMLKSKDTTHDWGHIERVVKNAHSVANYLNLDLDKNLLKTCALLHDFSFSKNRGNTFVKHSFEVPMTLRLLRKAFVSELNFVSVQDQSVIIEAIKHHAFSFPYHRLNRKRSLYSQVLQDADTIDYFSKERFQQACQRKSLLITYKLLKFIYDFGFHNLKYFLNFPQLANRFGRVAHIPLSFREFGVKNKKKIFFISGYASSEKAFNVFEKRVSQRYHLIMIDLPMAKGFFKRLRIDEIVGYIERVVEQKKIDEFELTGFSFGGLAAIAYASKHKDQVKKLVLLSTLPSFLNSRKKKYLYKLLKPILVSPFFSRLYVYLNTSKIIRSIIGGQKINKEESFLMRQQPVPIFSTFFQNIDLDLSEIFNELPTMKVTFYTKDDRILREKMYKKAASTMKADVFIEGFGGHNFDEEYQKQAAAVWLE